MKDSNLIAYAQIVQFAKIYEFPHNFAFNTPVTLTPHHGLHAQSSFDLPL